MKISILVKIHENLDFGQNSRIILILVNIFFRYVKNRHFGEFWAKSRIFEIFHQISDFSTIFTASNIFENFNENRDF